MNTIRYIAVCSLIFPWVVEAANLVSNGGFEDGHAHWRSFWSREQKAGKATIDQTSPHAGSNAIRIEHHGREDWSFNPDAKLNVKPGDLYELDVWVRIQGTGSATLGVVTYDKAGQVADWVFGAHSTRNRPQWHRLHSRLIIPPGITQIHPRLIGHGSATVWLDDFSLQRTGNLEDLQSPSLPASCTIENDHLSVILTTSNATFSVQDKRNRHTWKQASPPPGLLLTNVEAEKSIRMNLLHVSSGLEIKAHLELVPGQPELLLSLDADGEMPRPLPYPQAFVGESGMHLVVPMNEGISYPVDDTSIKPMRLIAYGGHGICMGFWGMTNGERSQMAILETADDAAIRIRRIEDTLCVAPEWDARHGGFGYPRRLRYVFFDQGGHVAMCKRYRNYVQSLGRLKTLQEKRAENPNVDRLLGAVNVWCWEKPPMAIVKELQALGIDRILWSNRSAPDAISDMNEAGILTSRYDIFQDVMDPNNFQFLRGVHGGWPTEAWPDDLNLDEHGARRAGWRVKGKNGEWYPCGVLCDRQAVSYARARIREDLETHAYRCRFIDTTTASAYRECYHPDHPMTRGESRHWKMELLRLVSEEMGLVTGSETGHDAAVPYVHYFEGMLSLGPYRVPDAGRDMMRIWDEVPERVARFQVGHRYRLPLWELVYHDCVVAQWYWGDYNNKLPTLWDKRDLFNILYGTPPMFMFNRKTWNEHRDRFVKSYRDVCSVARAVAYAEMTDHRFLTTSRDVQQTQFSNGVTVTVNFGEEPFRLPGGKEIGPMGFHWDAAGGT